MIALLTAFARPWAPPVPPPARPAEAEAGDAAPPAGCGWFDSSHELRAGLDVVEHASADAVAAQLPLDDWLALHLAGGTREAGLAGRFAL